MSPRSMLIVALSLVSGGSAAVWVNSLDGSGSANRSAGETVPVVVAAVDVPRFTTLTAQQLGTRRYPKEMVPEGAITKVEDVVNRAVFIPLVKGEPVLDAKLASKGAGRGMSALVPKGMRAFTIHTPNLASGVAGFVLPGNRVDVLLTADSKSGTITTTLLQNLEILAVDQRIEAPADNKVDANLLRSVTLLVTPDQAAKLDLGQNRGTLHLSLRNLEDNRPAGTVTARLADIEGLREEPPAPEPVKAEPAPPPPPPPAPRMVTVYRGGAGGARSMERVMLGGSRVYEQLSQDGAPVGAGR